MKRRVAGAGRPPSPGSGRGTRKVYLRFIVPTRDDRSGSLEGEEHGVSVRMIKSADPGVVVYQDRWQVAAIPRKRVPGGQREKRDPR